MFQTSRDIRIELRNAPEMEEIVDELVELPQNSNYVFFITYGYIMEEGATVRIKVSEALSQGLQPKFLDPWKNIVDCSGEIEGIRIREGEIICGWARQRHRNGSVGDAFCQVDPQDGLITSLHYLNRNLKGVDVTQVCIVDYENNDVIPFTDICPRLGSGREDPFDYDKVSYAVDDRGQFMWELLDRQKAFAKSISTGKRGWLLPEVTLHLSDGPFVVYPPAFGYILSRSTPFAAVNMRRETIQLDITTEVFSKVIEMITSMVWPALEDVENNHYLIEDSLYIYHALDYLGFDLFPELFQRLSQI